MPRIAYTVSQKAEAIALAVTAGAEYAAEQLGMDVRTVRGWVAKAGRAPELAAPETGWKSVLDLAMARVSSALAGNSVRPKDAAVIAGIASRNIREPKAIDPTRAEEDAFLRARERFGLVAVVAKRVANRMGEPLDDLMLALEEAIGDPETETLALIALQSYHQDHGCTSSDNGTYREPCPQPLADIWTYLLSIAPLDDWWEARSARHHDEMVAQLAANRQAAEAAQVAALDAETRALLASAEAWLAAQSEPAA